MTEDRVIICPYCEQDGVWQVRIDSLGEGAYCMCFECDTLWQPGEVVEYGTGLNFESFMEVRGQKADWTTIKKVGPLRGTT